MPPQMRRGGGNLFPPLPDVVVNGAVGPATLLRAANEDRIALVVTNNDAANNVRIANATVGAAAGARLYAGASITVTSTDAIYAIGEGAAVVTLSMTEELSG